VARPGLTSYCIKITMIAGSSQATPRHRIQTLAAASSRTWRDSALRPCTGPNRQHRQYIV